jgi:hypothetical protein
MQMRRLWLKKTAGRNANFVINFCQIILARIPLELPRNQEPPMRVSDDRYTRDRVRHDLALRLIRHEARTFTIRQWTGLSDDRIRKLYRSYVMDRDERSVLRHRGKSPRQAAYFFRNPELTFQSAQLASLYVMCGLLCGTTDSRLEARYRVGSLESGALICRAYEAYLELHAPPIISFEHAWFLLFALARCDEITLTRCGECGGLRLVDLLAKRRSECGNCAAAVVPGGATTPGTPPAAGTRLLTQLDTSAEPV